MDHRHRASVDRELIECSVCTLTPEKEIYQCKNGHSACANCLKKMSRCPTCREPLGQSKIRNRAMEALIAGLEVDCKYRKLGCAARMPRRELGSHLENSCEFGPNKVINLCKILGIANCRFKSRKAADLYRHLKEEHQTPSCPTSEEMGRDRNYNSFKLVKVNSKLNTSVEYMRGSEENRMGCKIAEFKIKGQPCKFLICYHANIKEGHYAVFCLDFGPSPSAVHVTVEITAPKEGYDWSFRGKPAGVLEAEETVRNPPLKISIPHLLKALGEDGNDELKCKISFSSS